VRTPLPSTTESATLLAQSGFRSFELQRVLVPEVGVLVPYRDPDRYWDNRFNCSTSYESILRFEGLIR